MTHAKFSVPDMSCAHCKAAVEDELNKLSGTEGSRADVENGVVEVSYEEGRVTTSQLKNAIQEAGYTVVAQEGAR